jgi:hypothetical protein
LNFAGALQNTGTTAEPMFPIISDRMVDQNLAGVFKIDNGFVRDLSQRCRIAVQSKERLRVFFD